MPHPDATVVHRSLIRPDRRLLIGCDREKLFSLIQYVLIGIMLVHTYWAVTVGIVIAAVGIGYLRKKGKNAYFFPVYERAMREQDVYPQGRRPGAPTFMRVPPPRRFPLMLLPPLPTKTEILTMLKTHWPKIYRTFVYDDSAHGLPDRLTWLHKLDPYTTLNKNGSMTRSYRYTGDDFSAATLAHRNASIAEPINRIMRTLGEEWTIHVVYDQHEWHDPYPTRTFPTGAAELVDTERHQHFETQPHFGSHTELHLTYFPADRQARLRIDPSSAGSQARQRNASEASESMATRRQLYERFVAGCKSFEEAFGAIFTLTPLGIDSVEHEGQSIPCDRQLESFLRAVSSRRQPVRALRPRSRICDALGQERLYHHGSYLRVGNALVRPLTVTDYPDESVPGILETLEAVPTEFRMVIRFIVGNPERVLNEIKQTRKTHVQKRHTSLTGEMFSGGGAYEMPDRDAVSQAYDSENAFEVARSGSSTFGYTTLSILLIEWIKDDGEDAALSRLKSSANTIIGRLTRQGFIVGDELGNELEAYLGAMPGNQVDNVIMPHLSSRNLCNLIVTSHTWTGSQTIQDSFYRAEDGSSVPALAVFWTVGRKPFYFVPLDEPDPNTENPGHTLIIGDTGSGKSSFVGFLANQHTAYSTMLPEGARQIIIDKDGSHAAQCAMVGGTRIVLGPETVAGFAPFVAIDQPAEFNWAVGFLKLLLQQAGVNPTEHAEPLYAALSHLQQLPSELRTMTALLQAPGMTTTLRTLLEPYSAHGQARRLFEGSTALRMQSTFLVFEMGHVLKDSTLSVPGLYCLIHEIERIAEDAIPTLLVSEEFWALLDDPTTDSAFIEWSKRLRKFGVWIFMVTHSIADFQRSRNPRAVLDACSTYVVLPSEKAATPENMVHLKEIGLEPWECEALAGIRRGKGTGERIAFIVQGRNKRLIAWPFGPVTRATVGITSPKYAPEAIALVEAEPVTGYAEWIRRNAGDGWARHYLTHIAPAHAAPIPTSEAV